MARARSEVNDAADVEQEHQRAWEELATSKRAWLRLTTTRRQKNPELRTKQMSRVVVGDARAVKMNPPAGTTPDENK